MKEKIFSYLDNSVNLALDLESELTKRPAISPESGGEGELDKCVFLEQWLKEKGITNLERYDAPDERAKGGVRPNLIATIEGSEGGEKNNSLDESRLWIMSHLDVVPPGELKLWDSDPWTVIRKDDELGSRIIGRGVEDNQQGLAASVLAALSFVSQGLIPKKTIKLLFAADEEVGSIYGIEWLIKNHSNLFNKNDMVLIPDGGDPKGEHIEVAEKIILWVKFTTTGKQSHGSRPDIGKNAFIAGSDLVLSMYNGLSEKFADKDPMFEPCYSTFQPTKKEVNVPNVNTIPGEDIFYMDMRILPRYSISSVLDEINRIAFNIEEKYNVTVKRETLQAMESKTTPTDAPIVKKLEAAVLEVYKIKPYPVGIGGGTVAANLRNEGIDCAVWTKTQTSFHEPNEYALLDNIIGDAKVMALLAL